jgi:hypothetical protein
MIIATRVLRLRPPAETKIPIRIFAPEPQAVDWSCRCEVDWPDGTQTMAAAGIDAVQALHVALQLIGTQIYTSDHHASGKLMWLEPGKGYGFPVANNLRDLLVGDDKRFL